MIEQRDPAASGLGLWLRNSLGPGSVVIDVGANVGDYVALAAQLAGGSGRVYAIEPAPENVARLRERFAVCAQVSVIAAAAGDSSGSATLCLDRRNGTRHSLASANVGKQGEVVAVQQIALDDLRDGIEALDVVKIDAQGAELQILRGARRLLMRFRPRVVLELWPFGLRSFGATPEDVLGELEALGYGVYRLSTEGRLKDVRHVHDFLKAPTRWRNINIVAVPA